MLEPTPSRRSNKLDVKEKTFGLNNQTHYILRQKRRGARIRRYTLKNKFASHTGSKVGLATATTKAVSGKGIAAKAIWQQLVATLPVLVAFMVGSVTIIMLGNNTLSPRAVAATLGPAEPPPAFLGDGTGGLPYSNSTFKEQALDWLETTSKIGIGAGDFLTFGGSKLLRQALNLPGGEEDCPNDLLNPYNLGQGLAAADGAYGLVTDLPTTARGLAGLWKAVRNNLSPATFYRTLAAPLKERQIKTASGLQNRGEIRLNPAGTGGSSVTLLGDDYPVPTWPDNSKFFNVWGHGRNSLLLEDSAGNLFTPNRIKEMIETHPDYGGQNVRLNACNAGYGPNCFAQNLANAMNVKVLAPDNYLFVKGVPGTELRVGYSWEEPTGRYVLYQPNNRPNFARSDH